jgi:hypothetical protein
MSYYDEIKTTLENRWFKDMLFDTKSLNKNGNRIGIDPYKFGLILYDFSKQFEKKLKQIKFESMSKYSQDDKYKYYYWTTSTKTSKSLGIPFQYIEKIPDFNKGANYEEISDIIGRFEPLTQYSNSTPHSFSIELIYHAECDEDNTETINNDWSIQFIDRIENQLKSLILPQYDGYFSPPCKVLLNIGNIYVDYPLIVKNVSVSYEPPFDVITMKSHIRKITLEVQTSYPAWQALHATQVWTADDGSVFSRQEFKSL